MVSQSVTQDAEVRISLSQVPRGTRARVSGSTLEAKDAELLRAMGIRPDACLQVCRLGEPCIVSVRGSCGPGCRIALSRHLADGVLVSPVT